METAGCLGASARRGRPTVGWVRRGRRGKSTITSILTDAWKAEGREVFGAVLSHTQVGDLAGIADANKTAMDPFLRRAAKGKYVFDSNSVIVVDEVGLLGNKQMRELLKLGAEDWRRHRHDRGPGTVRSAPRRATHWN